LASRRISAASSRDFVAFLIADSSDFSLAFSSAASVFFQSVPFGVAVRALLQSRDFPPAGS
jgi:hypothetical protein